jgi:hypothetical protein
MIDCAGATSSAACVHCLAGTYASALGATALSSCIPCQSGTYSSAPGSTSAEACSNTVRFRCSRDSECNYPGCTSLPWSPSCNSNVFIRPGSPANTCGWGYYNGGAPCPAGYTCFNAGGGDCYGISCYLGTCPDPPCAAGTYDANGTCVQCRSGTYGTGSGLRFISISLSLSLFLSWCLPALRMFLSWCLRAFESVFLSLFCSRYLNVSIYLYDFVHLPSMKYFMLC